jgi:hypothetical protein
LREVYPWNFLTESQLSRRIEGVSLQQWIGMDRNRGSIESFVNNMMLWSVKESKISRVQSALQSAGLIFNPDSFAAENQ